MSSPKEDMNVEQHLENVPSIEAAQKFNDNSDILRAQELAAQWVDGTSAEKRLVRKMDWRILPCTWLLYILGYLDRANISSVESLVSCT